jgi:hydroxymethylbilane synthase
MTELRIATRGSELAMAQARWVAAAIETSHPGTSVTLVEVTTTGDSDRVSPVATLTEVGAFVRAVQHAVLEGAADVAVHSCKDLPVVGPDELTIFYPEREVPWDVLCGHDLESLPRGARVGTGSPRRASQLHALRPDVEIAEIRGNVGTRLEKMIDGEFDAVVLAEAGLRRIGRTDEIGHRFSLEEMVPAPAQAALAVEMRADDHLVELVAGIDDPATRQAVETERALLELTHAGCRAALGAYAVPGESKVAITGFVEDGSGPRRAKAVGRSPVEAATALQAGLGL